MEDYYFGEIGLAETKGLTDLDQSSVKRSLVSNEEPICMKASLPLEYLISVLSLEI